MRTLRTLIFAVLALTLAVGAFGQLIIPEDHITYWNGSRYVRLSKGAIAAFVSASTTLATAAIAGGYGSSGVSIDASGNLSMDGLLTAVGGVAFDGWTFANTTGAAVGGSGADITLNTNMFTVDATQGNTLIAGSLAANGGIAVDSTALVIADTTGKITGGASADLDLNSMFTVDATQGDTVAAGHLSVGDDATFANKVTIADLLDANGALEVANTSILSGNVSMGANAAVVGTFGVTSTSAFTGAATFIGAINGNGGLALDSTVFTIADTTGVLGSIPTATTGYGWLLNGSTITSGDAFEIFLDTDIAEATGKAINITSGANYAGKASVFSVYETGAINTESTITLQNDETIDNAVNGTLNFTAPVLEHYFDATDYMTITLANSTAPVFDSVCGGTAGFSFSDPITVTNTAAQLNLKYGADDYLAIGIADNGTVTCNATSNGTANWSFSDPVTAASTLTALGNATLGADADASTLEIYPATTNKGTLLIQAADNNSADVQTILQNGQAGGTATITLPASTCTLPGLGITNSFSGANTFSATSAVLLTGVNAAAGSANPFDYTGTLGAFDNSDDFTLFDVNLTNADHAGTGNTVQVLDIAAITGDGQATETAINIGSGWDTGITTASPVQVNSTLNVTGAVTGTIPIITTVAETTNARVCTTADCGKTIILSATDAIGVTLPANGTAVGSYIDFIISAENAGTVTISPATADTLITANSDNSDAVTFATGHRLGTYVRCIAVTYSATTYWQAINLGQTTMGVTDSD